MTTPSTKAIKPNLSLDNFKELMKHSGHYKRSEIELYTKFNRFGYLDPYNNLGTTREYIFFTKPDLHIFNGGSTDALNPQIANEPIFKDAKERYLEVLKELQISNVNNNSPFINILYNRVDGTIDLPTITSTDVEGPSTIYGDDIPYRWSSESSDNNHEFSLDFEDTRYLEVYMLFKLWDEYERKKSKGAISPPNENYIINKILHDQVSVYKIIVGEDGETILFYAKLWGVYPKKVPREAFSNLTEENKLKFTVDFNATFVEDSNPVILSEFNKLVSGYTGTTLPIYNSAIKHIDGRWAKMPYIDYDKNTKDKIINTRAMYKLKWRL